MSNFKWMPLAGLNLSAANLAAAEKLRKFGFAVNCGEFGSEKYTKAGLCIYDVLVEKENPNILIVTSKNELYSWYRVMVTRLGADFKIITGSPNSLLFFNEFGAGLYLTSSEALFGENALKKKVNKSFSWDLIIIDEERSIGAPDYKRYRENLMWCSERLLINAPFPAKNDEDKAELISLIKSVLADNEKAERADAVAFDAEAARLDEESPVMRYFDVHAYSDDFARKVEFIDYEFEESTMVNLRRRVDLRSGLPVYRFGGNVFEAYDCEKFEKERRAYIKTSYTRSDVEDLRAFDKKLDSLLRYLDGADGRVMIYCCDKETLEYLRKALVCMYGADARVARDEISRPEDIIRKLSVNVEGNYPRILLGTDALGTVSDGMSGVDCIINYELPLSPALLERRMTRHGSAKEAERKFVIFRDKNGLFDSCALEKVLYPGLGDGFCGKLPARNILLDVPGKADLLNDLIENLKYIHDKAKAIENCLDLIKEVKCKYVVPEAAAVTNSKQLAEFAENMLGRLYELYGLDESSSKDDIAAAVNNLSGLCVVRDGQLKRVSERAAMADSFTNDSYSNQPFTLEALKGLSDAKAQIDELHKSDDFHLKIKQEIISLNDCIQYPVLYGIWKYRAKEQDSDRSFKDYIKIYNDGI
ncbi:MAG: hypothetical protein NC299_03190 [Lachnospiraceae bacterium]|nr:hypothetical protein [Ruminococcus sp.]MCM1274354.1 hypothetical protein [Lachnospiraceae bacterium]